MKSSCDLPEADNDVPDVVITFRSTNAQRRMVRYTLLYWKNGNFLVEDSDSKNVVVGIWIGGKIKPAIDRLPLSARNSLINELRKL